jgi:aldose 1-epimerase
VRLSCARLIELRCGAYTAAVAPEAGGRLASLVWHGERGPHPLVVGWDGADFDAHHWPKAGAFPMLPFANRLPVEGVRFSERTVRPLAGPSGFALHGTAHRRPWDVVEVTDDRCVLSCAARAGDEGWPWSWSAKQEVRLAAAGLTVAMTVKNESNEAMPLGMGWHPYHPVPADFASEDLQFAAGGRHELDAQGRALDASRDAAVAVQRGETTAFSGWSGALRIRTAGGAIVVSSQGAGNLVVHSPRSGDYMCAEPVSVLPGRLGAVSGEGVLLAGEERKLTWSCAFEHR